MDRVTIGNVEITAMVDSRALLNPHFFFPEHAEEMRAEFHDQLDERALLPISITTYLLRSRGKNILVDTGVGPRRRPNLPRGKLDETLAAAGIAPEEIDVIVHTHLHVDHVGWNTVDGEDGLRFFFPRAQHHVNRVEWEYWTTPERVADPEQPHLAQCVVPLADSGRLHLYDGETALDEEITFLPTPGHTPGHVAVGIYSAGERAVIIGDASHHPVHLVHPDWSPTADSDPVQSAKTRTRLIEEATADGRTWLAGHWPYPGMGRIVLLGGKRVFQAL